MNIPEDVSDNIKVNTLIPFHNITLVLVKDMWLFSDTCRRWRLIEHKCFLKWDLKTLIFKLIKHQTGKLLLIGSRIPKTLKYDSFKVVVNSIFKSDYIIIWYIYIILFFYLNVFGSR